MKWWCVSSIGLALTACNPGSAATSTTGVPVSTTVAIAAPTASSVLASAVRTTPATTTQALTTAPRAATAPPTAAEVAELEIRLTLEALDADFDACFAAPDSCEIDTVLDQYFAPDDEVVRFVYRDLWERLWADNLIQVVEGRYERTVVSVTTNAEGVSGTSYHCEVDNTIEVPKGTTTGASTTSPLDFQTGYIRYYFEWQRGPDSSWRISRSELGAGWEPDQIDYGALPSLTESEIAQCF